MDSVATPAGMNLGRIDSGKQTVLTGALPMLAVVANRLRQRLGADPQE